jgi:hypothetical protein
VPPVVNIHRSSTTAPRCLASRTRSQRATRTGRECRAKGQACPPSSRRSASATHTRTTLGSPSRRSCSRSCCSTAAHSLSLPTTRWKLLRRCAYLPACLPAFYPRTLRHLRVCRAAIFRRWERLWTRRSGNSPDRRRWVVPLRSSRSQVPVGHVLGQATELRPVGRLQPVRGCRVRRLIGSSSWVGWVAPVRRLLAALATALRKCATDHRPSMMHLRASRRAAGLTPLPSEPLASVSRAFPSYARSILTEIYLCHPCLACHEIEDGNARAGHAPRRSRGGLSSGCAGGVRAAQRAGG